ncbi:probable aminopeptidase NPEPL1 isoform X1 [Homarus americanus]|uniref:probable aminopeptidase NPEPL1 isoform X1 n=3 Tax=Homarus americanus TaxID=6706 RepID=UPI001C4673B8|nr:probable aminopeptidase NPEPL1 isoform X1 [Homarus americanus]
MCLILSEGRGHNCCSHTCQMLRGAKNSATHQLESKGDVTTATPPIRGTVHGAVGSTERMGSPMIRFKGSLSTSDPRKCPVLIIGQLGHLAALSFSDVAGKLQPRVDEEAWTLAVNGLQPSPTDYCSLYLNLATVAALPVKCSRHNTPSRTHSITKIIKTHSTGTEECIVLVCERADLFASACGVARAYPTYSRKTAPGSSSNHTVTVELLLVGKGDSPLTDEDIEVLNDGVYGVRLAARIVDTPANEMHTDSFIGEVQEVANFLGIKPLIIRGEELSAKGFGGIYGVGKAAVHPPALVVLSHHPPGGTENVAWVGKGIVYDTGGLSIKTKTSMPGMKRDCGGAAAILGAFYVAVRAGYTQNLHAVFCLAENAVGPTATKPDDIHTLYSGRTVEINNTDAEGRLVLSDGVAYAAIDLHCTTILDMATLTGAQGTATGKFHGAVLTNNQQWEEAAVTAGQSSGDLIHPLPYSPELHFAEFASAVADMKNSMADRSNATSSCAGLFIAAHLGFDFPGNWIHVDMAYPVHCGERATGYGVALLPTLFGHHSQSRIFRNLAPISAENGECENDCKASKKMRLS